MQSHRSIGRQREDHRVTRSAAYQDSSQSNQSRQTNQSVGLREITLDVRLGLRKLVQIEEDLFRLIHLADKMPVCLES